MKAVPPDPAHRARAVPDERAMLTAKSGWSMHLTLRPTTLGRAGISRTELHLLRRADARSLVSGGDPPQTGASPKGATPHTIGALFLPPPVLLNKHAVPPITELSPKGPSAFERSVATGGNSERGCAWLPACRSGNAGSAAIFSPVCKPRCLATSAAIRSGMLKPRAP